MAVEIPTFSLSYDDFLVDSHMTEEKISEFIAQHISWPFLSIRITNNDHLSEIQVLATICTNYPSIAPLLIELRFQHNNLLSLPASIPQPFTNLTVLDLSSNKLTRLPNWIGLGCTKLERLRIDVNEISAIPRSLLSLVNLNHFSFNNNPLPPVHRDVRTKGALQIIAFFVLATNPEPEESEQLDEDSFLQQPQLSHQCSISQEASEKTPSSIEGTRTRARCIFQPPSTLLSPEPPSSITTRSGNSDPPVFSSKELLPMQSLPSTNNISEARAKKKNRLVTSVGSIIKKRQDLESPSIKRLSISGSSNPISDSRIQGEIITHFHIMTSKNSAFSRLLTLQFPFHGEISFAGTRLLLEHTLYASFREAGRTCNVDTLARYLAASKIPSIDVAISDGRTFLHLVCGYSASTREKRLAAIQFCIKQSVSRDVRDIRLNTALHLAGQIGCVYSFVLLLNYGFQQHYLSENHTYPLQDLLIGLNRSDLADDEVLVLDEILSRPESISICISLDLVAFTTNQCVLTSLERALVWFSLPHPCSLSLLQRSRAVAQGDLATFQQLVQEDPDMLRTPDPLGYHPAAIAVKYGHIHILRFILSVLGDPLVAAYPDGSSLLHISILAGQTDVTTFLIEEYPSLLFKPSSDDFSPLHVACLRRNRDLVETLLGKDLPPNGSAVLMTPILFAAFSATPKIIELLVSSGALIETAESLGFTAYEFYTFFNSQEAPELQSLLTLMHEVDERFKLISKRQTHLSLSRLQLTDDTVSIVLNRIASLNHPSLTSIFLRDNKLTRIPMDILKISTLTQLVLTKNPIQSEIERQYCDAKANFLTIIKPYLLNLKNCTLWQLVDFAAFKGDWTSVERYLRNGFISNSNQSNPLGETLLHLVLKNPNLATTSLISFLKSALGSGADPNSSTFPDRETPLHFAARLGCLPSICTLLDGDANCFAENLNGQNFLHLLASSATKLDCSALFDRLVAMGVFFLLTMQDRLDCVTPLDVAIIHGSQSFYEAALERWTSNTFTITSAHQTTLHLAIQHHRAELVNLLKSRGFPLKPAYFSSLFFAEGNSSLILESLFSSCIFGKESLFALSISTVNFQDLIEIVDANGYSLLHLAVRWGQYGITAKIVNIGASFPEELKTYIFSSVYRNKFPYCSLDIAIKHGHLKILELLLQHVETSDLRHYEKSSSSSLLMLGCMSDHQVSPEIVCLLLRSGADPEVRSSAADTVLHFATASGSTQTLAVFLGASLELISVSNTRGLTPLALVNHRVNFDETNPDLLSMQRLCRVAYSVCSEQLSAQLARPLSLGALMTIKLRHCHLNDSEMSFILRSLGKFPTLRALDLSENSLTRIPSSLLLLTQLRTVNLNRNPSIQSISESRLIQSTQDYPRIKKFLTKCEQNHVVSQKYMKVVICGREAAGKTSLAKCLIRNQAMLSQSDREFQLSTDGIDISQFSLGDVTVSLWDFAGQIIYESIHQFMLSQSVLYLIAWDIRRRLSESYIIRWCQLLRSRAENCRVFIIGTHLDLIPSFNPTELNRKVQRLCSLFPFIVGSHVISTVSGNGVSDFRRILLDLTTTSYIPSLTICDNILIEHIEHTISNRDYCPVVTFEKFLEDVSKFSVFSFSCDPQTLLYTSLKRLHQVGKLLFFTVEKPLSCHNSGFLSSNLIALNPKWLVGLMASVITTKLSISQGIITSTMFAHALGSQFSSLNRAQLLALLCSFGCLIPISNQSRGSFAPDETMAQYLIPALLPLKQPDTVTSWLSKTHVNTYVMFERACLFTWRPPLLFNLLLTLLSELGMILSAWKKGVLILSSVLRASSEHFDFSLYAEEIDSVDPLTAEELQGIRFLVRVPIANSQLSGGIYELYHLRTAAKVMRRLQILVTSIVSNVFPGSPITRWVVPCSGCNSQTTKFTGRFLFPLESCIAALAGGGSLLLDCPLCKSKLVPPSPRTPASSDLHHQIDVTPLPSPRASTFHTFLSSAKQLLMKSNGRSPIDVAISSAGASSSFYPIFQRAIHSLRILLQTLKDNGLFETEDAHRTKVAVDNALAASDTLEYCRSLEEMRNVMHDAVSAFDEIFSELGHSPSNSFLPVPARTISITTFSQQLSASPVVSSSSVSKLSINLLDLSTVAQPKGSALGGYSQSVLDLAPDLCLSDLQTRRMERKKDFSIENEIAKGGFGRVFRATIHSSTRWRSDSATGDCALKLLDSPAAYLEFVDECLNISNAIHPNIVAFCGFTLQPVPGILLEYVEGGNLFKYIHDPWNFLASIEKLYQEVAKAIITRGKSSHIDETEWTFESVFQKEIKVMRSLLFPPHAESITYLVPQILSATKEFWVRPERALALVRDSLIDEARLAHLSCLQAPESSFSSAFILRVGFELAQALQYLHSLQPPLVHLDIKTLNVLLVSNMPDPLTRSPILKLADFGSAREYLPSALSSLCSCNNINMAARWASPEVSNELFHPKSDVWGWGLVIWELFSREIPFEILDVTMSEDSIKAAIMQGSRPTIPPHVPDSLVRLLQSCWKVNHQDRPSSSNLLDDLTELIKMV